jgi:hypothetical protein
MEKHNGQKSQKRCVQKSQNIPQNKHLQAI